MIVARVVFAGDVEGVGAAGQIGEGDGGEVGEGGLVGERDFGAPRAVV